MNFADGMPFADQRVDDRLAGDAFDRRLARGVNIGHEDRGGIVKRAAELVLQRLRPRVAVRLKHDDDALAAGVLRGGERRADFARMMRVIVDHHVAIGAELDLEPPARAAKRLERLRDFRERHAELRGERDDRKRVAHIVPAGDVERDRAERLAVFQRAEMRLEILRVQVVETIYGAGALAVRDRARVRRAEARGVHVVGAIEDVSLGLREQLLEGALDRGEVLVIVEMLLLDVEDDRVLGMVEGDRAVALVALGDHVFAVGIPVRIRAEDRNFRADIVRRMQARVAQDVGRHRGRRGLAVHAGDDDAALAVHDRGERIRAAHHLFAEAQRVVVVGIAGPNRGRIDDDVRVRHALRVARHRELEPEPLQAHDLAVAHFVAAADLVPEREQAARRGRSCRSRRRR